MKAPKRWLLAIFSGILVFSMALSPMLNAMAETPADPSGSSSSTPEDTSEDNGNDSSTGENPGTGSSGPADNGIPGTESGGTAAPEAAPEAATEPAAPAQPQAVYTVRFFDWDGAALGSPQSITGGEAAVAPPDPGRAGWRFTGWSADFSAVTADMDIYAQYAQLLSYTVTINYEFAGGTVARQPAIFSVEEGGSLSQTVVTPIIPGYTPDQASVVLNLTDVQANQTFTVVYTPAAATPYKVEHYQQNLTLANTANPMDPANFTLAATDNLTGTTGALVTAVSKAYTGFTAPAAMPTAHIAADGTTVIRVFYTRNQYAVYFDSNGGSFVAPISALYGAVVVKPANPTRPGYAFGVWQQSGSTFNWPVGMTMPAADINLTATWTTSGTVNYTVVYWLENIASTGYDYVGTTSASATAGTAPAVPASPGVTFPIPTARFALNSTKTNAEKPASVNGDGTTILNVYYDRGSYTLNFVFNATKYTVTAGGTTYTASPYQLTAKYGASINAKWPANPALKSGQSSDGNFTGWQGSNDLYVTTQYFLDEDLVTGSPLTATFDRNTRNVTVYYMFQNVSGAGYTANYTQTVAVDRDTDTWNAKTFDGFTVQQSTVNITSGNPNTATFYYNRNQYKITYYNGGTIDSTISNILYQASISGAAYNYTPSRPASVPAGYTFAGWYTTPQGYDASKFVFTGATMPAYNLILYARWDKPTYTATFVPDNGGANFTQTVQALATLTEPAAPTKAGYVFGGWYLSGSATKYVFNFPVTGNLTLTARWIAVNNITYDVVYMKSGVEYQRQCYGGNMVGNTVTAGAITIPGFLPDALSKSLVLAASGNVIVFNYSPFTSVGYTVRYRLASDASVVLSPDKTAGTAQASITENYVNVPGYYPDYYQQTLQLTPNAANNVITFLYTPNAPVNYTVITLLERLDGGYDTTSETKQAPAGSTVTETPPPYTGFTYQASLSTNGRVVASNGSTVIRLYYTRNQFTVTFTAQGNGSLTGQTTFSGIKYGTPFATAVTEPVKVAQPGYMFDHWQPALPAPGDTVTSNATYTAVFVKDDSQWAVISFDANGGEGAMADTAELLIGSTFTLPANTFIYEHFDYTNWNTADDGSGYAYGDEETITVTGSMTLFAQWSAEDTWGIIYLPCAGTGGPVVDDTRYYTGEEVTVKANLYVRPGYLFDHWVEQGTSDTFTPGGTFEIDHDMILKAVWTYDPLQWVTIHYDKNNTAATGTMADETVLLNAAHSLMPNAFALTNNSFGGWMLSAGAAVTYTDGESITPTAGGTLNLFAKWNGNPQYTVTYHANDGTAATVADGPAYAGTVLTVFPADTFTYEHNDFARWNTQADGLGTTYPPGGSLTLAGNVDLYARWHAREAYTITYKDGIPGSTNETIEVQYADADGFLDLTVGANPFMRPGYQFVDWLAFIGIVSANTQHAQPGAVIHDLYDDITFTAQWETRPYTITYDLDGGTVNGVNPTQYTVETPTFTLVNPTKPGYTFTGWTGTDLENATVDVTISQGARGSRSYTAHWVRDDSRWVRILFVNSDTTQGAITGTLQFEGVKGQPTAGVALPAATALAGFHLSHWSAPVPDNYPEADLTITVFWTSDTSSSSSSTPSSSSAPSSSSRVSSSGSSSSSSRSSSSNSQSSSSSSGGGSDSSSAAQSSSPSASVAQVSASTVSSSRSTSAISSSATNSPLAAGSGSTNSGTGGSAVAAATPSQALPTWALLNLIIALMGVALAVVLALGAFTRRARQAGGSGGNLALRVVSIVLGVVLAVIFLLTQNLTGQMIVADMWTILMAVLFVGQGALSVWLWRQLGKNAAAQ